MTTARRKDGYTAVYMRDGTSFAIAPSDYEAVRDVWMKGSAFVECASVYGAAVVIKCAEINGVSLVTAEVYQANQADGDAEEREAALGFS